MTRSLGVVAGVSKACSNARPCVRHGYSQERALSEGPCVDTQTGVDAAAGVGEVALNDSEFEAAMKEATVSDERANNSRPSLPKSTLVFAQHSDGAHEISISGNQMLVALAAVFCLAGPLVWAFVRYWLFAP